MTIAELSFEMIKHKNCAIERELEKIIPKSERNDPNEMEKYFIVTYSGNDEIYHVYKSMDGIKFQDLKCIKTFRVFTEEIENGSE